MTMVNDAKTILCVVVIVFSVYDVFSCSNPQWAVAEGEPSPALLDHEEALLGSVPAIRGVRAQCQTGEVHQPREQRTHTCTECTSHLLSDGIPGICIKNAPHSFVMNVFMKTWCLLCAFYVFYTSSHLQRFFISTLQALDWLQEAGEYFLSTHNTLGDSPEKTQELLKEYENFCVSAKVSIIYTQPWKEPSVFLSFSVSNGFSSAQILRCLNL